MAALRTKKRQRAGGTCWERQAIQYSIYDEGQKGIDKETWGQETNTKSAYGVPLPDASRMMLKPYPKEDGGRLDFMHFYFLGKCCWRQASQRLMRMKAIVIFHPFVG